MLIALDYDDTYTADIRFWRWFQRLANACDKQVIIAAAGGAAHLAGVVAAHTHLPVLGVPMQAWSLDGLDSLLSTVQMPRGVPVGTLAIGKAGAVNAALLAAQILGNKYPEVREAFRKDRERRKEEVLKGMDPRT